MTKKKERKKPVDGVRDATNMVDDGDDEVGKLKERIAAMATDWATLNEFLNRTARAHHWCSEYEERLHYYNSKFTVLKLVDRKESDRGHSSDPYWQTREDIEQDARLRIENQRHHDREPRANCPCYRCAQQQREAEQQRDYERRMTWTRATRADVYTEIRRAEDNRPVMVTYDEYLRHTQRGNPS